MHINVAQLMLKQSFPELGGLQNVLLNNKNPLANTETGLLQILHINNNHWGALSYFLLLRFIAFDTFCFNKVGDSKSVSLTE